MSQSRIFNRMPRIQEPLPVAEVKIPAPPNITPLATLVWFQMLMPLAGVLVMVAVYGGMRGDFGIAIPMAAMSAMSMVSSMVLKANQRKEHQQQIEEAEVTYTQVLEQKRAELERYRREQQKLRLQKDPDLPTLLTRVEKRDRRLWERRPDHEDFLSVRLGVGALPSTVKVEAPHPDMPDLRLERAHALEAEYQAVPQIPILTNLCEGPLGIAGSLPDRTRLAQSVIAHLVVHHAAEDLIVMAVYTTARTKEWEWLKWLPHTYALTHPGMWRLANDSKSVDMLTKQLLEELHQRENQLFTAQHSDAKPSWPWIVVLIEDYAIIQDNPAVNFLLSPPARKLNVTALFLVEQASDVPMGCHFVAAVDGGRLHYAAEGIASNVISVAPEYADVEKMELLARNMAAIEVSGLRNLDNVISTNVRLLSKMEVNDLRAYDVKQEWRHRELKESLNIIIGERMGNQSMILDLKHTGHGPHGLIAGTTGSGKSELVQTLITALALTHHPYDVGFILVDFKGGGTFQELQHLPHTLGMITNLSGNLTMRALVALEAEIHRREELFNQANVRDIGPYQDKYWKEPTKYPPLPRLVVIIDEFAELVSDYPDFMDGLISIARVGRSLGINLILATQSPGGVVKQQIWANAKFRICLRVESRQESTEMLHRPEAANLPRIPGRGYLQVGNNDVFELFQVARVAGSYHVLTTDPAITSDSDVPIVIGEVSPLGQRTILLDTKKARADKLEDIPTDIEKVVETLQYAAEQMHIEKLASPWPEALPEPGKETEWEKLKLSSLLEKVAFQGWNGQQWTISPFMPEISSAVITEILAEVPRIQNRPWLSPVIGLLDEPAKQRQIPFVLPLNQQDGQLILIGAPGSGKSMLLRTMIASLVRAHTPEELNLYFLEFSGQTLRAFEGLPHSGGLFTPADDERIRRLFRRLLDTLELRKAECNRLGVDNFMRLLEIQVSVAPAIVMFLTGFMEFRTLYQDEVLQDLIRLIREGGPYGIHVILAGDRAGDVPMAISSVISRRIALRLADSGDYSMVLGVPLRLGKDAVIPVGRGWYGRPPLEFQTAIAGDTFDEVKQLAVLQKMIERMKSAWAGKKSPDPVENLPDSIPLYEKVLPRSLLSIEPQPTVRTAVPLGLDGVRMQPVLVDLVKDGPNFIVCSTPQGGKTTLLRTWALTLAHYNTPQQIQFIVISGRRKSLQVLENLPHTLEHCVTPDSFQKEGVVERLIREIDRREDGLHNGALSASNLATIVVLLDDYDEFYQAVGSDKAVADGLTKLAKRGRDVGIHTIVSGPLPSMGVAYSDPLVAHLKLGRSGFVLRILDVNEQNPIGLRLRAADLGKMPPGRGYIVRNGIGEMLHIGYPGEVEALEKWVSDLQARFKEYTRAMWAAEQGQLEADESSV